MSLDLTVYLYLLMYRMSIGYYRRKLMVDIMNSFNSRWAVSCWQLCSVFLRSVNQWNLFSCEALQKCRLVWGRLRFMISFLRQYFEWFLMKWIFFGKLGRLLLNMVSLWNNWGLFETQFIFWRKFFANYKIKVFLPSKYALVFKFISWQILKPTHTLT